MTRRTNLGIPLNVALFFAVAIIMVVAVIVDSIDASYGIRESDVASYADATYTKVTFQHLFGSSFWVEGPHEYTLAINCPGSNNDIRTTHSFRVSTDAPLHSHPILLRAAGLRTRGTRAGTLTEFNPNDASAAWAIVQLGKQEDAEACQVLVAWDGGQPAPLGLVDSTNFSPGDGW